MKSLLALLLSLSAVPLPAQLLVVDPLGGGTHIDLQTAINAAPAGAVIRVRGGTWGPLRITRSVTIVGENTPRITAPLSNPGPGSQPAGITLQGTGTQTAVLAGLDVSGMTDGATWNFAGPGISSSGFVRLAVHDCTVRGHDWTMNLTGFATGAAGIAVTGPATLHVARSVIAASRGYPYPGISTIPNGAHAIAAPAATVVVLDSMVRGGSVDPAVYLFPLFPSPCPCGTPGQEPGRGGTGISAAVVHASGSTITGGTGSPVLQGMPPVPFGNQPDGVPILASAQTTFATVLSQGAPLRLGRVHAIGFASTSVPALLALGSPLRWPTPAFGIQFVFVDVAQPLSLHFLPVPSTAFSLAVPANVQLLGVELSTQRFDLGPGGAVVATNPLLAVVLP
jgi:hypothetical protein